VGNWGKNIEKENNQNAGALSEFHLHICEGGVTEDISGDAGERISANVSASDNMHQENMEQPHNTRFNCVSRCS
jgi:hypothetical protein